MTPYYEHNGITIYHGDCRDIVPTLSSADLILTDPPYVGLKGGYEFIDGGVVERTKQSVSVGDPWAASWEWILDVISLKPSALITFTTYQGIRSLLNTAPVAPTLIGAWHKPNAHPGMPQTPHYSLELYVGFRFDTRCKWLRTPDLIIAAQDMGGCVSRGERIRNVDGSNAHPTQKPIAVMRKLVLSGAQSVLDPFMGTGTTLLAAYEAGIKAIGIEIEERYCEIAAKRLSQLNLFSQAA